VTLPLSNLKPHLLVLSWDMRLKKTEGGGSEDYFNPNSAQAPKSGTSPLSINVNVTITVRVRYETQLYYLHYTTADFFIKAQVL
jgi:hypothetical protein